MHKTQVEIGWIPWQILAWLHTDGSCRVQLFIEVSCLLKQGSDSFSLQTSVHGRLSIQLSYSNCNDPHMPKKAYLFKDTAHTNIICSFICEVYEGSCSLQKEGLSFSHIA
ncbi:hypothetical protein LIER_12622 [Lithospermum erythrorhizon]|uniref:Uncharacterized protein n=1 Tax=Lithospermum erythrorhizon TaxID=34254 RepID=A0AAV3PT52_LITER